MVSKFFSFTLIMCNSFLKFLLLFLGYFYFFNFNFWILVFKMKSFFYFQLFFLVPKVATFLINFYKKNFLFFYSLDFVLSSLIFLFIVNHNLDIIFPIIGVVYNRILFEDEEEI